VRAVAGDINDTADGGESIGEVGYDFIRSAGFGNVLNVDPRDV
jgi:hypothetical protein